MLAEVRDLLAERKLESNVTMVNGDAVFRVWCAVVRNEQGQIAGVQGVASDISEQVQVEQTCSESAARWRSLVEEPPEFIYTVDRQGRLQFINHTASGRKMEDLLGAEIYRFALSEDVPRCARSWNMYSSPVRPPATRGSDGRHGNPNWYESISARYDKMAW